MAWEGKERSARARSSTRTEKTRRRKMALMKRPLARRSRGSWLYVPTNPYTLPTFSSGQRESMHAAARGISFAAGSLEEDETSEGNGVAWRRTGGRGGEGMRGEVSSERRRGWGGTLVMFIARYLVGVRKRRKERPRRKRKRARRRSVDGDDENGHEEVDDDVLMVGEVKESKGKRRKKKEKGKRRKDRETPNDSISRAHHTSRIRSDSDSSSESDSNSITHNLELL
jgi:hypothetical protein